VPAIWRIQDQSTFAELGRRGRRIRQGPIVLSWVPGPVGHPPRVAFAVSRSVGNAVTRNRVRRRLRALMVEMATDVPSGAYLFRASPAAAHLSFDEMRSIVSTAIAAIATLSDTGARRQVDR